ncbi:MAG: class I SAM-dependent DNA methyltransferase [Bryobacteraceae bacterium]
MEADIEAFLAFLDTARRATLPDVVPFLVEEFHQVWAASGFAEGQSALTAFLLALCAADNDPGVLDDPAWRDKRAAELGIQNPELSKDAVDRARGMQARAPDGLKLIPSLVLRHAAGRLFQEAHALLESVQLGLFGRSSITTTPLYSPAGAYFTPVPIARLLAEWALQQWARVSSPDLTIADFACGSAVFLVESLRVLERLGFRGSVRLIGCDKSPQAVTMANVAIRTVQHDMPTMRITSDIRQADAFDAQWPEADIVLMNPPFRSWEQMDGREREWVNQTTKGGRPDLSVGFIERALSVLRPSGVLATLVPAGVLASEGLSKWRDNLLQRATPSLIAVLGEHGLFQHALVNVGILALQNTHEPTPLHVAWSSAETGAASRAIRAIRRSICGQETTARTDVVGWSVTVTSLDAWKLRPSWLPGAGALGSLLETIQGQTPTQIMNLFHVRQGIRTGANEAFIQSKHDVESLPRSERRYFIEAVDAASFVDGEVQPRKYLFVPDRAWQTELEVQQAVPTFFEHSLRTMKAGLMGRKSLLNPRWWELTRPRAWAFDGRPRLLSKRFGLYPAFARDFEGRFAVVQANAWTPIETLARGYDKGALREILTAYWWLLNSRVAVALLREYCPNVAGGQLDLENKYVKHAPMPDLRQQFKENPALQVLASSIRSRNEERLPTISERDQFAAAAFRTDISAWNLSGLEIPE